MNQRFNQLTQPKYMRRFHIVMMILWSLALIPTLLWWKDSILWVATMSLYANFVGHFASYQATRGEENRS